MPLYDITLDADGCFPLPPDVGATLAAEKWIVAALGAKFSLASAATACVPLNAIFLWPLSYFEELRAQFSSLPPTRRPPLLTQRIFDNPRRLNAAGGRLCLPASLRDDALIASRLLLRGNNSRYELWNPNAFQCRAHR
ncbi:MAG TPA: hypothetical protein DEP05_08570 [Betaproteobacteria bacterium]|nr:hypothetical protein [Betaproteobacteria bacterium]